MPPHPPSHYTQIKTIPSMYLLMHFIILQIYDYLFIAVVHVAYFKTHGATPTAIYIANHRDLGLLCMSCCEHGIINGTGLGR